MNIGTITKPNQKGQIVIPKAMRDKLHITEHVPLNIIARGRGIYIYPITDVVSAEDGKDAYIHILEKTQGTWTEDWKEFQPHGTSAVILYSSATKKTTSS